jgi:hypothetical protein
LYRFTDEQADSPKGCPIPIQSTSPTLMRHVPADGSVGSSSSSSSSSSSNSTGTLPESPEPNCIYLSSLRKTITVKCANQEECVTWVRAILSQKSIGIRQHLGHAPASDKRIAELDLLAQEKYNNSIAREIRESDALRRKAESALGQPITTDMDMEGTAEELASAFRNGNGNGSGRNPNSTYSPMTVRSSQQ